MKFSFCKKLINDDENKENSFEELLHSICHCVEYALLTLTLFACGIFYLEKICACGV